MARPKKPDKRQVSFNDVFLEDPDIAECLATIAEGQHYAKLVRDAGQKLRKLVDERHPSAINSDQDGIHSGYVTCMNYRFWAGRVDKPERAQLAKTIPAAKHWQPLDVHRADLFAQAGEAVS